MTIYIQPSTIKIKITRIKQIVAVRNKRIIYRMKPKRQNLLAVIKSNSLKIKNVSKIQSKMKLVVLPSYKKSKQVVTIKSIRYFKYMRANQISNRMYNSPSGKGHKKQNTIRH